MAAQRLRDVGIGLAERDQKRRQVDQRSSVAALFAGNTDGGKARLLQPFDLFVRQHPLALALERTLGPFIDALKADQLEKQGDAGFPED